MKTNTPYEVPPIAFMIFNRPDYTRKVFEEICRARPSQLFIIADGPRTPAEEALCKETRAITERIDWPCEVKRNYAEKNMGLKKRFHTGLTWFFEHVEAGVILEDDCLPHPSFFRFMAEMLEHYRDDERIMMITGDNFVPELSFNDSYFFSRYFPIWGWATWRRVWQQYDPTITAWTNPASRTKLQTLYPQPYMREHMQKIFDGIVKGTYNTWDIQWLYLCVMNKGFCITPSVNLVSNIGVAGTHTEGGNQNLTTKDLYTRTITHPQTIIENMAYDNTFYEKSFKPPHHTLLQKIRFKIIEFAVRYEFLKKIYRFLAGKKK